MKRLVLGFLGLLVGLGATALLAPSALAHGGQFRGPGGAVPPGLREPSDPTPPPPPPPSTPPPTTPPDSTPPSGGPPPTTPPSAPPPVTGPPPVSGPEEAGPRKPTSIGYENWTFWWGNNKDDILNIKESIYRLSFTSDNPLSQIGGARGNTADATRATEKQVKEILIPALHWAMDTKNKLHSDIESASYIALAKTTDDPAHIRLLQDGVKNEKLDKITRESSALALGLLRRGEGRQAFDARELDRVRDFLFETFENKDDDTRVRAFAMLALGLLADQPTARGNTTTPAGGGGLLYAPDPLTATTTARIYELLKEKYSNVDLPVSLILSLSLQAPETVTLEMTEALKECALKGRLFKDDVNELVQSYAALALGRVGPDTYIEPMLNVLTIKGIQHNVKRSAMIALGQLGRRIDGQRRADLAGQLLKAVEAAKDASTKNFGTISLAYLLEADIKAQRTDVINARGTKVSEYLIKLGEDGNFIQRPFGALALGIVGRAIGEKADILAYGELREKALLVLRAGLEDQKMDKRSRASFAIGLGMLRDAGSKKRLVEAVSDKSEDKEFRAYSAVALGMIGEPTAEVVKAITEAMKERSSEELRQQTAVALGLLSDPSAVDVLLDELKEADTQNVQGQIVLALAQIGDARTIEPLVALMKDSSKPDLTRALSCAGLGLIGDLEFIPSLSRISKDINYRAAPDAINEVLSIL
jgi:HEAT repeat protein